jgi:eukaryotic-like serine/threonine-protein kinase
MTEQTDPRFEVRAPLRCDGVGRLDCAVDAESGDRMAIRWLPLEANGAAAAEAVETMPIHPVLPRIRGTGRTRSSVFVAMDFPEGRLLSTVLQEPLRSELLCRMGRSLADALATIHDQQVVHGELSTESVLLLPDHSAVLWDMPLVITNRLTDRRGEARSLGQLPRVAPFVSPERARGLPATAAGDVYALGAVLCLAGGGELPKGDSTLAIIHQVASGSWRPTVPEVFPLRVRELVAAMIHPDPLSRPSAREVADALGSRVSAGPDTMREFPAVSAERGVLPEASPAEAGTLIRRPGRRRRWLLVAAAALLVGGLGALFAAGATPGAAAPESAVDLSQHITPLGPAASAEPSL